MDWTVIAALASVAAAIFAWSQARQAKKSAAIAERANALSERQLRNQERDSAAARGDLFVVRAGKQTFRVENNLDYEVESLTVDCFGLEHAAHVWSLQPGDYEEFKVQEFSLIGHQMPSVSLRWETPGGEKRRQRVSGKVLWGKQA